MISKQEIMDFAREFSLSAETIEKDYVLGWLLAGIANHPDLLDQWVFKGGTCLKKCYFETYRFSEDLDYTLTNISHLNERFLVNCFNQIANWIYDASGIELPTDSIRFEIYQNNAGKISSEGRVYYIGPLNRRGSMARIKLDLTADELLVLPAVLRDVHHPYSDKPKNGMEAHCYNFAEVFAEKIRALGERARPRDLYDVVHLYRHATPTEKPNLIFDVLQKKCEYKKISVPTMQLLNMHPKLRELEREWPNMLAHQLPILPAMQEFWQELPNIFDWLHGNGNKILKEVIPQQFSEERIDYSWQPPSMIQAWHMNVPIELIRYAGANYLYLEIIYNNKARLIEPYNLKRTLEGNIILIAIESKGNEWKSFRIDRIQNIKVTATPFKPQYDITLTPFTQDLPKESYNLYSQRTPSRQTSTLMYNYTIQCPICNKKFKRQRLDTKLNAHKSLDGGQCPGRRGYNV